MRYRTPPQRFVRTHGRMPPQNASAPPTASGSPAGWPNLPERIESFKESPHPRRAVEAPPGVGRPVEKRLLRGGGRRPAPPLRLRLSPLRRRQKLWRPWWCSTRSFFSFGFSFGYCCRHSFLLRCAFAFAVRLPFFSVLRFPSSSPELFRWRWCCCCGHPLLLRCWLARRRSPKVGPFHSPQVWTLPATQGRQGVGGRAPTH